MDTGWWVALGVVVLCALVAAYVDGTGRLRRPGRARRGGARSDAARSDGSRDEHPPG